MPRKGVKTVRVTLAEKGQVAECPPEWKTNRTAKRDGVSTQIASAQSWKGTVIEGRKAAERDMHPEIRNAIESPPNQ